MRAQPGSRETIPAWSLAVAAMLSVQLGSALSVRLIATVGPAGTAWLRLSAGAIAFLVIARPPLRTVRMADLGPLAVAAARSHRARALAWPALALAGVGLLTQPWRGDINLAGAAYAGSAAIGWATYILLTRRIGDRFSGLSGLSLTIPVAAGLALLLPVLPFALEMLALRRMAPSAFGTLMALEPTLGVLLGLIALDQRPSGVQLAGVLLVVAAAVGAQRGTGERLEADPAIAS